MDVFRDGKTTGSWPIQLFRLPSSRHMINPIYPLQRCGIAWKLYPRSLLSDSCTFANRVTFKHWHYMHLDRMSAVRRWSIFFSSITPLLFSRVRSLQWHDCYEYYCTMSHQVAQCFYRGCGHSVTLCHLWIVIYCVCAIASWSSSFSISRSLSVCL